MNTTQLNWDGGSKTQVLGQVANVVQTLDTAPRPLEVLVDSAKFGHILLDPTSMLAEVILVALHAQPSFRWFYFSAIRIQNLLIPLLVGKDRVLRNVNVAPDTKTIFSKV